jgi:hypothetical protein
VLNAKGVTLHSRGAMTSPIASPSPRPPLLSCRREKGEQVIGGQIRADEAEALRLPRAMTSRAFARSYFYRTVRNGVLKPSGNVIPMATTDKNALLLER